MAITKESIGLGLRVPHYRELFSTLPSIDFFEIISENFMELNGLPYRNLLKVLEHYPVVLHGTELGIANSKSLDLQYLKKLKKLTEITKTPYFTDHLCWTSSSDHYYHDLLPIPYTERNAQYIAERISEVQDYIGLPFGLENLSSYVTFKHSEMTEWEFYNFIVEKSGCHYMLDLNNIFVSSVNHGFDPYEYLKSIRWKKVLQCHIAGHTANENGTIIDTHDNYVCAEVWELYKKAWKLSGGFPTLLEWDDKHLSLDETHQEALKSKNFRVDSVYA